MNDKPITFERNDLLDTVTIQGVIFSQMFFRAICKEGFAVGRSFTIEERDDIGVTIRAHKFSPREARARAFEEAAAACLSWKHGPQQLASHFNTKAKFAREVANLG